MQSDPIRKLILEHPELPIVFMANEDANNGDYSLMFCAVATAEIGEILDCWQDINPDVTYTDRDDFREAIDEHIYGFLNQYDNHDDAWFDAEIKRIEGLYEPYWRDCILIKVGN